MNQDANLRVQRSFREYTPLVDLRPPGVVDNHCGGSPDQDLKECLLIINTVASAMLEFLGYHRGAEGGGTGHRKSL
jgi:hypothetical protein